jgi:hypothetical protein
MRRAAMWGQRQTSDDRSAICVQAAELAFSLAIPAACHRIREKERKSQL